MTATLTPPAADALTEPYWAHAANGVLAMPRCQDCDRFHFYPKPACPHCRGTRIAWAATAGRGFIASWSIVHRAPSPAFADKVPYAIAVVRMREGPQLMTRLVGIPPEAVRIDLPVRVRFEQFAGGGALPVFEPDPDGEPNAGAAPPPNLSSVPTDEPSARTTERS